MTLLSWLATTALIFTPSAVLACEGEAPVARLEANSRIVARAQSGLRIEGRTQTPRVVSSKRLSGPDGVSLQITDRVTQIRDVRPVWKRAMGGAGDYRDVLIPRQIELKPERTPEEDLLYEAVIEESGRIFRVQLLFRGGMQRGGCGGEVIVTPLES
jgi:hypothetical protein